MVERARTARVGRSREHGRRTGARGAALLGLATATGAAALTGALLGLRTASLAGTGTWRVESAVELGVTAVGALVATWLAASAGVALVCSAVRAVGASWRTGERLVQHCAPTVVRRVLVLAIGAGVGLAGATGATAAAPAGPDSPPVASSVPSDLGWASTTTQTPPTPSPPTALPHAEDGAPHGDSTTPSTSASTPGAAHARLEDPRAASGTGEAGDLASTPPDAAAASAGSGAPTAGTAFSPTASPASPDTSSSATADGSDARGAAASSVSSSGPVPPDASSASGRTAAWSSTPTDGEQTVGGAAPGSPGTPATPVAGSGTVVVQAGDTLWGLAARHLPAGADDATVAEAWPRWYAANVAVIGDDPDLLVPGQVLVVPATDGTVAR